MYTQSVLQSEYAKKRITAEDAAKLVKSGFRMQFGLAHGATVEFDKALAKRADELKDITIYSTLPLRKGPFECFNASKGKGTFQFFDAHFGGPQRKMAAEGSCWFIPQQFHELPQYWAYEIPPFDIFICRVGPMDSNGYFNIGPQVAEFWGSKRNARITILEVADTMPYACGYMNQVNLADVDYIIEGSNEPLLEIPDAEASEVEKQIARYVIGEIQSKSCIQIGIGGLSNVIGKYICESDITDLSGHTEMLTNCYLNMFRAGKISGYKNVDKGKLVYTFTGGSKELYDFIDHNDMCWSAPVDYVNSVPTIGRINNLISINNCLSVDLYGQISAESVGFRHISGTGGQLDFVLGSYLSKGGKSIMCLPSVKQKKDGTLVSNIVPYFAPGTIVTTPRSAANYIVTEYGIVNLKGKSTWERAEALISIAHPQFRDDMIRQAEAMGIWKNTSKIQ